MTNKLKEPHNFSNRKISKLTANIDLNEGKKYSKN